MTAKILEYYGNSFNTGNCCCHFHGMPGKAFLSKNG